MGIDDEKPDEKEHEDLTVDLSKQKLKKLERASTEQQQATALIVDDNELQKLDNMDSYSNLKKLSAANNQIFRMYWVSNLVNLEELNLSNNSIVTIEGLRDLKLLKYLNLSKNKLKSIDNLNTKTLLEKIDLSDNNISHISDLSSLQNLKALYLHSNRIYHLKQCGKNLPKTLECLTLNTNLIEDLNEISHLVHLLNLKEFSIANNPCVEFRENKKFNYRPFIKNWCSGITVIDDKQLNDIECLKAEWLYSQGRGRSFRPGEHALLVEYLLSVCPREVEDAENEDLKKLKLILSKAQQHQKQLREQLSTGGPGQFPVKDMSKSLITKKKSSLVPERMVASFQEHPQKDNKHSQEFMTRSLDSEILKTSPLKTHLSEVKQTPLETSTTFIPVPDTLISPDVGPTITPRPASICSRTSRSSSRNSPHSTPESKRKTPTRYLMRQGDNASPVSVQKPANSLSSTPKGSSRTRNTPSPGRRGSVVREPPKYMKETSEDEDSELLRVMAVQQRANQRKQKLSLVEPKRRNIRKTPDSYDTDSPEWKAAVCIQRRWRGYRARNLNKDVLAACSSIQMSRMQDYITKVMTDMEATRDALERNRKLLVFHMQAIHGLWKKMTTIQPAVNGKENEEKVSLQGLADTCANLNKQVESLQTLVKTMQNPKPSLNPIATQTEIVAVHTPQGDCKEIFFTKTKQMESLPGPGSRPMIGENVQETDNFSMATYSLDPELGTEHVGLSTLPLETPEMFQAVVLRKPSIKLHGSEVHFHEETEEKPKCDLESQELGNS